MLAFGRAALNFSLREHRKAVLAADSLGMVEAVFIHTRNTAVLGMHVRAFCDLLPHECRSLAGVDLVVCVAVRGIQILRNRTQFIQRNDIVEVLLILVFLIVVQANALRAEHRRFQRITVLNGADNAAAALTAKRTGRFTVRTGHVADAVAVIDMAAANPPGQTADVFAAGDAAGIVAVVEVRLIRIAGQTADIIRAAELACVIAVRHLRAAPAIADQTAGARTGAGDSAFVAAVSDRDVVFAVVRYRAAVIADQTAGFTRAGHRTNVPAALNVGVPAAGQHHTHKTAGSDAGYAAGWGVDDRHIRGNAAERAETAQIRCRRANAEALCRLTFNLDLAFERQIANNRNVVLVLAADRAEQAKTLALLRHILHVKVQAGDGLAVAIEDTGKAVFARADGRPRLRQGDIVHQLALDVGFASVDLITEPLELCLVRDLVAAVRVLLRYARVYHWELIAAHAGAVALVGAILSLCLTNRLAAVLADCRDGVRAVVLALVFGFCMLVLAFRFFHFCIGHPCQDGKTGFLARLKRFAQSSQHLRVLHARNYGHTSCANRVRGCEAVLNRTFGSAADDLADGCTILDVWLPAAVVSFHSGKQTTDRIAADDFTDIHAVFNRGCCAILGHAAKAANVGLAGALRFQRSVVRAVFDGYIVAVAEQAASHSSVARAVGHGHIDVGCNLFQRNTAVALSNDAASINRHIAARRSRRGNHALDDQLFDRRVLRHAEQCSRITRGFCNVQAGNGFLVAVKNAGERLVVIRGHIISCHADGRPAFRQRDIRHQPGIDRAFARVDLVTEPLEVGFVRQLVVAVNQCRFCWLLRLSVVDHPRQERKTVVCLLESAAEGRENLRILHVCNDLYAVCANRVRGCEAVLNRTFGSAADDLADGCTILDVWLPAAVVSFHSGKQTTDRIAADDFTDIHAVFNRGCCAILGHAAKAANVGLAGALRFQRSVVRAVFDGYIVAVAEQAASHSSVARAVGHGHIDVGCNLFQRNTAVALSNDAASINRHIAARRSRRGNHALDDQLFDRRVLRHAEQCSRITRGFCNVQAGNGFLVAVKNAGERLVVIRGHIISCHADGRPAFRQRDIRHQPGIDRAFARVDLVTEPLEVGFVRQLVVAVLILNRRICGQCDRGEHTHDHDQSQQKRYNSFLHRHVLSLLYIIVYKRRNPAGNG